MKTISCGLNYLIRFIFTYIRSLKPVVSKSFLYDSQKTKKNYKYRQKDERTKVWTWNHGILVNAWKSDHECWMVLMNAQWCDHERTNSLLNAGKSEHELTEVWWTRGSLVKAGKSDHDRRNSLMNAWNSDYELTEVWFTHQNLNVGIFRLGRSGHIDF